jgi:hypothetical protein
VILKAIQLRTSYTDLAIVRPGRLTISQRLDGGPKDRAREGMTVRAPQSGRDGTEREDREDESERGHHVGSLFGEDLGVRP